MLEKYCSGRTFGSGSLPRGNAIDKLRKELGIAVVVHRDRDFLSDSDKDALAKKMEYDVHKVPFWMPKGSDIEAGFCELEHLRQVFELDVEDAETLLAEAVGMIDRDAAETDFNTAYQSAVGGLDKTLVGVPSKRWRELGEFCPSTIKGKVLLDAIKRAATTRYSGTEPTKLNGLKKISVPSVPMNEDLKALIETAMLAQKK